jgi:phosphopantetheinyl transferase (holo-ACP synthase)
MNIDKRLEEARRDSWVDSRADSRAASQAAFWATSEAASRVACGVIYWAFRYKECSYEIQIEILKGLLNEYR